MNSSSSTLTSLRPYLASVFVFLAIFCFWNSLPKGRQATLPVATPLGTPVSHTGEPGELIPIQDVQLGQRVIAKNPTGAVDTTFGTTVDPKTWRKLIAVAPKADGSLSYIELLRPERWLEEQKAESTGFVTIQVPECGISGEALLLAIEPCPLIVSGTGPIVTGFYEHESAAVLDVYITGLEKPIGTTANHPFWSEDRKRFIPAGELEVGERLSGINCSSVVTAIEPRKQPEVVYNLEVLGEHCYRVCSESLLVHNPTADDCVHQLLQLNKYADSQYIEALMARAGRMSLNRARGEGLVGRAAGVRAEELFEKYAYEMQLRLMKTDSPYRITLQPAADAATGLRTTARTKSSFIGRWMSGTKRLDYGFYNRFEGNANSATIISGADFTVRPDGAFGIPSEYSTAFPKARIRGIDPVNITE